MTDTMTRLQTSLAGRYLIERELGRGGMATVYLARDLRQERPVAVKVLHPELSASLGTERFLREIALAGSLKHPHVMGIYDSGDADGLPYYVMPFIEGESLRDRLDRERQLPIDEALRIACQVADALAYAHAQGVVHRDIKPENILLSADRQAVVADFGIARAVTVAGGEKLTQTGMAIGTPTYMSPEQAAGSRDVTGQSDLYSLGCVVYEMLAGQPPFTGPTPLAIMARHSLDAVPGLQIVRGTIPDAVEDAVVRALEKVPADRFATATDFAEALRACDPATGGRRTVQRPARGTPKRAARPYRLALLGLLVLPLLGGAWAGWRYWLRPPGVAAADASGGLAARRVAVLYFDDLSQGHDLGALADGLTEDLIGELDRVAVLDVVSRNGAALYRHTALDRDSVARALGAGTLVVGSVERDGDGLRVSVSVADGASGVTLDRESFEHSGDDLLAARDSLARSAARMIRTRVGEEVVLRERRAGAGSVAAWLVFQRGEQARKLADSLAATGDTAGFPRAFATADSLFAESQRLDPEWVDPVVLRGTVAYRRSRLAGADPEAAARWIGRGMELATQALALEARSPDALELRGTLRYWQWLLGLAENPAASDKLLEDAKADLEAAVAISPAQAGAHAVLSHLYNQTAGELDAKLAAQRAYEADAYLTSADAILSRLFLASYDLGQFSDAQRWCAEGERRFPADAKFVDCRLWLLTANRLEPDVPRAWRLQDSLVAMVPPQIRDFQQLRARMAVAAVLARAGLADSARRVAARSRGTPELDPSRDLLLMEAFVHALLRDRDAALQGLKTYVAVNPERRTALGEDGGGWWFRSLADDPGFLKLVGR